jgi:hypothetical protein
VLRRAWDICREHARDLARAAKVPGEGWIIAGAFDEWRGQAARRGRGCGAGAAIVDDALSERGARPPTAEGGAARSAQALADPDWTRHARCAARRAGYAQARAGQEDRARAEALAIRRKRARDEAQRMQAGLRHWGVAGPLPQGASGVAALGPPYVDDGEEERGSRLHLIIGGREGAAKRPRRAAERGQGQGRAPAKLGATKELRGATAAGGRCARGARNENARAREGDRRGKPHPFRRRAWSVKRYLAIPDGSRRACVQVDPEAYAVLQGEQGRDRTEA